MNDPARHFNRKWLCRVIILESIFLKFYIFSLTNGIRACMISKELAYANSILPEGS